MKRKIYEIFQETIFKYEKFTKNLYHVLLSRKIYNLYYFFKN